MRDLFPSREASPFGRRLKRERGARIPVTVVTGFLGAGKTTLIRRFLASPEGEGTAVIVNEFGAVGIDDALIRDTAEQTVLLGNSCVCCITRTDLQLALRGLLFERERGTVPNFARIVIETSGLADPAPILQTFSTDRALGGEFHIDVMLAAADAVNGEATLERAAEARKQVILADRLVVTKADLATPGALECLTRRLQNLNSRAAIDIAADGVLDADRSARPTFIMSCRASFCSVSSIHGAHWCRRSISSAPRAAVPATFSVPAARSRLSPIAACSISTATAAVFVWPASIRVTDSTRSSKIRASISTGPRSSRPRPRRALTRCG